MNKIMKIIIRNNPAFKYVVEDYPFYEGIFFHEYHIQSMYVRNAHYMFRNRTFISIGIKKINAFPKLCLHLRQPIYLEGYNTNYKIRCKKRAIENFKSSQLIKPYIRLAINLVSRHRDINIIDVNAHYLYLTHLKEHDPYILENRDVLTLKQMDEREEK